MGLEFSPHLLLDSSTPRLLLEFDFDVHAGREVQAHQGINCFGSRIQDVYQTLVRPHLEVFHGLFINGGIALDRENFLLSRQQDGTGDSRARSSGRIHNLLRALVQNPVVECLQANSYFIFPHHVRIVLRKLRLGNLASPGREKNGAAMG